MRLRFAMADGGHEQAAAVVAWWVPLVGAVSAGIGAFGLWLANRMIGKAAFQTAINAGFNDLTDRLQQESKTLRAEMTAERLRWAASEADLRGSIINLTQTIESLKSLLRKNGIPVPERYEAPVEMIVVERSDG